MAAKNQKAIEVHGLSIVVDEAAAQSWDVFKLLERMNDDDLSTFDKLTCSFELIKLVTGITESEIVVAAGGGTAPALDVVRVAMDIVNAIKPKN